MLSFTKNYKFLKQTFFKDSKTIKLNHQKVPVPRIGTAILFKNSTGTDDTFFKQIPAPVPRCPPLHLPSETAARASVAQLAFLKEENIRELLRNKKASLFVDEAEMDKQNYINVLVGSLDTLNEIFLIECLSLESSSYVNSSIILHAVDDVLRQLGTKRENFALLLADAARFVSLAG